jgi:hypothetical protein
MSIWIQAEQTKFTTLIMSLAFRSPKCTPTPTPPPPHLVPNPPQDAASVPRQTPIRPRAPREARPCKCRVEREREHASWVREELGRERSVSQEKALHILLRLLHCHLALPPSPSPPTSASSSSARRIRHHRGGPDLHGGACGS